MGITIKVIDHGEGIAPDELPRVFDRFFRGRAAQGKPGAGLGLYLAKRIVNLHRGDISVASQLGQGSVFSVSLPANPSA